MSKNKFFVYGTLKVGGYFAGSFDHVRTSVEPATLINHDLFAIGPEKKIGFPGAVPGSGKIVGEVHEYEGATLNAILKALDRIEGYNEDNKESSLYLRSKKTVVLDNGNEVEAFVYIFNGPIKSYYSKIKTGIWNV